MCLEIAKKEHIITTESISTRSLFRRSQVAVEDVCMITFWIQQLRRDSIGFINIHTSTSIKRIRLDAGYMNSFMPNLFGVCRWAYIVDCDHGQLIPPVDTNSEGRICLEDAIKSLLRGFYFDITKHITIIAGIVVFVIVAVNQQGIQSLFITTFVIVMAGFSFVIYILRDIKRIRMIKALILQNQATDNG